MRTRARALLAALALAGCAPASPAEELGLRAIPAQAQLAQGAQARLLGMVELRASDPAFGGFSALEVSAEGARIVALSDRGAWLTARLAREGDRLTGLRDAALVPFGEDRPVIERDSEGLAIASRDLSGPRFVSYERDGRVERDDAPFARSPDWRDLGNTSLEGLAIAPDGRLLVLQERPVDGLIRGWWIDREGAVSPTTLQMADAMAVTGADFGPDGALYTVTRTYNLVAGFRFGVRRHLPEGDGFGLPEPVLDIPFGEGADNGEGIALWQPAAGPLRILVITDDNMNLLQRTYLYEFELIPQAAVR